METNKSRWIERHAAGQTKVDVAIETQAQAVAAEFTQMKADEAARASRVKANPVADLQAAAAKKAEAAQAASDLTAGTPVVTAPVIITTPTT
jgi:hypothetical protein